MAELAESLLLGAVTISGKNFSDEAVSQVRIGDAILLTADLGHDLPSSL
jgi:hypothetical protein